jgi:hypothetical protein
MKTRIMIMIMVVAVMAVIETPFFLYHGFPTCDHVETITFFSLPHNVFTYGDKID